MRNSHGLANNPSMESVFAAILLAYGRGGPVAAVTGGTGFLSPRVHIALIIIDYPGNIIIFAKSVVEGAIAYIVNGTVAGKDYYLAQHIVKTVDVSLVQTKFSPQSCSRGCAEAIVACLIELRLFQPVLSIDGAGPIRNVPDVRLPSQLLSGRQHPPQ